MKLKISSIYSSQENIKKNFIKSSKVYKDNYIPEKHQYENKNFKKDISSKEFSENEKDNFNNVDIVSNLGKILIKIRFCYFLNSFFNYVI